MPKPRRTQAQRVRLTMAASQLRDHTERRMQAALKIELIRVTGESAASYPKSWSGAITAHEKRTEAILKVMLPQTAIAAARVARGTFSEPIARQAGMMKFLPTQAELDARIAKLATKRAAAKASEISETTRTRIANAVARGTELGEGQELIAKRIKSEVGGMSDARAKTIARTESASAVQTGQYEEMAATSKALDMKLVKTWVATGDERTRESHEAANGQSIPMDKPFSVGGAELMFPSDPNGPAGEVINCRCGIVYDPA